MSKKQNKMDAKQIEAIHHAMIIFENKIGTIVYTGGMYDKEKEDNWQLGAFYCHGVINDLFKAFMLGATSVNLR